MGNQANGRPRRAVGAPAEPASRGGGPHARGRAAAVSPPPHPHRQIPRKPNGNDPRLLQLVDSQDGSPRLQRLAQPEHGAVKDAGGVGEARAGRQGRHGGRLRAAVQARLPRRPEREVKKNVRMLPFNGHRPRRRNGLPFQLQRRLLQRSASLLLRAVWPGSVELLQGGRPLGENRGSESGDDEGEAAGEIHPDRDCGWA